ncbi:hypothetical protein G9U53_01770 [Rhodococcus sp. D-46]|jgi:hypothetical protein|uniref:hypothetical protein n=1 Tax=Rhodococcus TaxID=1827 RepID=UPI0004A9A203|nr:MULTISPECIES: hypothetical protein [Rhodococcus]MYV29049.1 hypothetical protein [Rhodococcus erythropolis]NHE63046.1 hypothetical protein [Rhodococcus sp. D-46]ANQ73124.1 hypothetical protein AOT96_21425 [Rhodococcus sp. 008]ARE33782.1 hypothetical protein A0W34_10915 [Rhodococcus sp. BH4]AZI61626.1 hypothetical protein EHW12_10955 [Rhodococcus sp. NJ-530]
MKFASSQVRSALWTVAIALAATSLSGCIGAVDRMDFDNQMRERGGGMTSELVRGGFDSLAHRYGVDAVSVTSIDISPIETLGVTVRDPGKPTQLDRFSFDGVILGEPSPVQVSVTDDLDARSFTLDQVPALTNLEKLVDDALENSGVDDGEVTGISVSRTEAIRASVMVESPRSRALVVFEPDGTPFLVHPL